MGPEERALERELELERELGQVWVMATTMQRNPRRPVLGSELR